jgi:hypothetical protein
VEGRRVQIADVPEAGEYAGRVGQVNGWSSLSGAPDEARTDHGPVVCAYVGGSARSDIVYGVWFEETNEVAWFPPLLLDALGDDPDSIESG